MADFIIRIELHNPGPDSYDQLHAQLAAVNVRRDIIATDGRTYQLPSATYRYEGDYLLDAVRDWIIEQVTPIHGNFWVLVTQAAGSAWRLSFA